MDCPECAARVEPGRSRCSKCGASLKAAASGAPGASPGAPRPSGRFAPPESSSGEKPRSPSGRYAPPESSSGEKPRSPSGRYAPDRFAPPPEDRFAPGAPLVGSAPESLLSSADYDRIAGQVQLLRALGGLAWFAFVAFGLARAAQGMASPDAMGGLAFNVLQLASFFVGFIFYLAGALLDRTLRRTYKVDQATLERAAQLRAARVARGEAAPGRSLPSPGIGIVLGLMARFSGRRTRNYLMTGLVAASVGIVGVVLERQHLRLVALLRPENMSPDPVPAIIASFEKRGVKLEPSQIQVGVLPTFDKHEITVVAAIRSPDIELSAWTTVDRIVVTGANYPGIDKGGVWTTSRAGRILRWATIVLGFGVAALTLVFYASTSE